MFVRRKLAIIVSGLLASQGVSADSAAVDQEVSAIERITVSTRKLKETLETVPLSISVLTEKHIKEKGVSSTDDLARYINGVSFDVGAMPNDTRPSIRGLTIDRGRPNVAILVDGVDVSSESLTLAGGGMTANMKLLDLQQVEVVKGPQSVNYGRSAFSGAINYVTKRPGFDNTTTLGVDVGQYGKQDFDISWEGGVTDSLAARVKLINASADGYYTNPNTGGQLGKQEVTGASLSFQYVGDNGFNAYLRAEKSDEEYGPRPVVLQRSLTPGTVMDLVSNPFGTGVVPEGVEMIPYLQGTDCTGAEAMPYWDSFDFGGGPIGPACRPMITGEIYGSEEDIDLSPDPVAGSDFAGTTIDSHRVALEMEWEFDSLLLTSMTALTNNDTHIIEDFDFTNYSLFALPAGIPEFGVPPFTQYGFQSDSDTRFDLSQISQEIRLSGETEAMRWVANAMYWSEKLDTVFASQWWLREGADEETLKAMLAMTPGMEFFQYLDIRNTRSAEPVFPTPLGRETKHWSVAGLVEFAIGDDKHVTVEGRFMDETIDYYGIADDRAFASAFGLAGGPMTVNSVSDNAFLPRASFDWQINETVFTYGSIGKGFKPGGVTTTDGNGDVSTGEYKPETLVAYEIGAKAFSMENNAVVNMAMFYYDYTDQQVPFTITDPMTGFANVSVVNAGATEAKGIELDSVWQVIPELRLAFSYLYSDARYKDFNVAESIEQAGLAGNISATDMAIAGNENADFSGQRLTLSPKHTATFSAAYETAITDILHGFVELHGQYRSERNVDRGGWSYLPAYIEWDLSLGLRHKQWTLTAYITNLTDNDKIKSAIGNVDYGFFPDGFSVPWGTQFSLPAPREAGIRLNYHF